MKDTRELILERSIALFLQKSFKEVTMKEIVETTQMSKGAFYHYFRTKEQIFLEIVENIYATLIEMDYKRFKKGSLREFYEDYLSHLESTYELMLARSIANTTFDVNYYSLIFDAIRFFPDFKQKMIASSSAEATAWTDMIRAARQAGEIKSPMNDEQVASIFVHTNSGIGMNNIVIGRSADTVKDLRAIWGVFYESIKA